jgi:hypothetical protein
MQDGVAFGRGRQEALAAAGRVVVLNFAFRRPQDHDGHSRQLPSAVADEGARRFEPRGLRLLTSERFR